MKSEKLTAILEGQKARVIYKGCKYYGMEGIVHDIDKEADIWAIGILFKGEKPIHWFDEDELELLD